MTSGFAAVPGGGPDDVAGLRDVTVVWGETVALDRVSAGFATGSITTVVGGDGAGKTTLLRALVGQAPLASGWVSAPATTDIGYMPAGDACWRDLTVAENIAFVGEVHGLTGRARAARAEPLLEAAGLQGVGDRLARNLSGGMRKKLGFILASMHEPRLLVLDEPSTGVDPVSRIEIWRLLSTAATRGTAVVLATTYLDEAERSGQILGLEAGRILVAGDLATVLASSPGRVFRVDEPLDPRRSWLRGRARHEWRPDGQLPAADAAAGDRAAEAAPGTRAAKAASGDRTADQEITLALEDAVIVASLREEARS